MPGFTLILFFLSSFNKIMTELKANCYLYSPCFDLIFPTSEEVN